MAMVGYLDALAVAAAVAALTPMPQASHLDALEGAARGRPGRARQRELAASVAAGTGAFPSAVPCARLHSRQVVWEWGLRAVAETVELVVSELVTNAVKASAVAGGGTRISEGDRLAPGWVALFLASDRHQMLVQIWDGDPASPQPADVAENAKSGRGLLLVEALSEDWGWYWPAGSSQGKWVWAAVGK